MSSYDIFKHRILVICPIWCIWSTHHVRYYKRVSALVDFYVKGLADQQFTVYWYELLCADMNMTNNSLCTDMNQQFTVYWHKLKKKDWSGTDYVTRFFPQKENRNITKEDITPECISLFLLGKIIGCFTDDYFVTLHHLSHNLNLSDSEYRDTTTHSVSKRGTPLWILRTIWM